MQALAEGCRANPWIRSCSPAGRFGLQDVGLYLNHLAARHCFQELAGKLQSIELSGLDTSRKQSRSCRASSIERIWNCPEATYQYFYTSQAQWRLQTKLDSFWTGADKSKVTCHGLRFENSRSTWTVLDGIESLLAKSHPVSSMAMSERCLA